MKDEKSIFIKILQGLKLETLKDGDAKDHRKEKIIQNGMQVILTCYDSHPRRAIDFSHEDLREAYCVLYGTSHINMISKLFSAIESHTFDNWLHSVSEKNDCRMCCVGGGPGTDFIGFVQFLRTFPSGRSLKISCTILDLYEDWQKVYQKIQSELQDIVKDVRVSYSKFDFLMDLDNCAVDALGQADLVMFVKSMSAFPMDQSYRQRMKRLLKLMKPGSLLLFVDNVSGPHSNIMMDVAESLDFRTVICCPTTKFLLPMKERRYIREYAEKSQANTRKIIPQTNLTVTVLLFEKMENGFSDTVGENYQDAENYQEYENFQDVENNNNNDELWKPDNEYMCQLAKCQTLPLVNNPVGNFFPLPVPEISNAPITNGNFIPRRRSLLGTPDCPPNGYRYSPVYQNGNGEPPFDNNRFGPPRNSGYQNGPGFQGNPAIWNQPNFNPAPLMGNYPGDRDDRPVGAYNNNYCDQSPPPGWFQNSNNSPACYGVESDYPVDADYSAGGKYSLGPKSKAWYSNQDQSNCGPMKNNRYLPRNRLYK